MSAELDLSPLDIDALREVMNITTAKVADAWAKMSGHCILINVPALKMVPVNELPLEIGAPSSPVIGVYFKIYGDISGSVLLLIPMASAMNLIDMLWQRPMGTTRDLAPDDVSAIKELGNILINSFTSSLYSLLKLDHVLVSSIPHYANDLLSAVIDYVLIEVAERSDYALLATTVFSDMGNNLQCSFLVFPELTALRTIISRLSIDK